MGNYKDKKDYANKKDRMKIIKDKVIECQIETPIVIKTDVLVVGGGAAGIGAAVAAKRNGAKVILIEGASYLGGTATTGLMAQMEILERAREGIAKEFINRMVELGGAVVSKKYSIIPFEPEYFKYVAEEMMNELDIDVWMNTIFLDAIMSNNVIKGAIVHNKSGRQAILADVVIDASGDGDVAAASGAPYQLGRKKDNKMQPISLLFRMGNVDIKKMVEYIKENPDNFTSQDPKTNIIDPGEKIIRVQGFFSQLEEAIEKKEMDPSIRYIRLDGVMMDKNNVVFNTTRVYGIDGTKAEEMNRATPILRKQIMQLADFAKKYMPGFENAYLDISASNLGIRETRHIIGEYVLTYEDIVQNSKFDDVVLISHVFGYHEKRAVVHYPDQILEGSRDDVYSRNQVRQYLGPVDLPYRSLIPKQIENLLLAGRNLSADHYATNKGAGGRNIPKAMNTGQVSGTAAALSIKEGVIPRLLDVKKLQRILIEQGIDLENRRAR